MQKFVFFAAIAAVLCAGASGYADETGRPPVLRQMQRAQPVQPVQPAPATEQPAPQPVQPGLRPMQRAPIRVIRTGPSMAEPYALAHQPPQVRSANQARTIAAPFLGQSEAVYLKFLCDDLATRFQNHSVGYEIAVVLPSGNWCGRSGGMARRAPDDAPRAMTVDDKITVASVSKTITATALLRALNDRHVSVDKPVAYYLPDDWVRGPGIASLTFRQLLTHKSGIHCGDKYLGWALTFSGLRQCIADGSDAAFKANCQSSWTFACYKNENFALMRVLIPRVVDLPPQPGLVAVQATEVSEAAPVEPPPGYPAIQPPHGFNGGKPNVTPPPQMSESDYANAYIAYVNKVVFQPLGLPTMYCKPTDAEPALSYKSATANPYDFSSVQPGEIWGDMTLFCGSQGWFLSAHQLAIFMSGVLQSTKVLPAILQQKMEDGGLGLYWADNGNGLGSWSHGGYHPAESNMGEVNTLVISFNNGVSIGVVINSKFIGDDGLGQVVAAVKAAGNASGIGVSSNQ